MTPAQRLLLSGGLRPTLDFRFTDGVIDSRITAGANGTATCVNGAGAIAAQSAPRFDYNPATLAPAGLLVEEGRTNLLLNSLLNGTNLSTQSVTTAATPYTLSFYGTGTVTLTGTSTAGPAVGTGVYPNRKTLTFTPTAGSLTLTVSGTVQYAMLEAGSFATSEVYTSGTTAARGNDAFTLTGGNLSWFNTDAGTFVVEFDTIYSGNAPATHGLIGMGAAQRFIYVGSGGNTPSCYDGTTVLNGSGNVTNGAVHKIASAYDGVTRALCTDGGAIATAAQAAGYTSGTTMYLGGYAGGDCWNGHLRRIRYWKRRLPDTTLQALTQ